MTQLSVSRWPRSRRASASGRGAVAPDREGSGLRDGRDPWRGRRGQRRARGDRLLVLLAGMPGEVRGGSGAVYSARRPPSRHSAPPRVAASRDDRIYTCPMHPEVRQNGPGRLPEVRHGPRAGGGHRRGGAEPRADRHEPALLGEPGADRAGLRHRHGGDGRRRSSSPGSARRRGSGSSSCCQRRSCSGAAGRSSCAPGSLSGPAASTCSP